MADRHVENDLASLKGIGPKYAEMLKSIGIDSIKELRHRNPANLKKMIEDRHGRVVGMSEDECRTAGTADAVSGPCGRTTHPRQVMPSPTVSLKPGWRRRTGRCRCDDPRENK